MAVVPICYKVFHQKDLNFSIPKDSGKNEGYFMVSGSLPAIFNDASRSWSVLYNNNDNLMKWRNKKEVHGSQESIHNRGCVPFFIMSKESMARKADGDSEREKLCKTGHSLESSSSKKQLRSLDSYLGKLNNTNQPSSNSLNNRIELLYRSCESKAEKALASLDVYLDKLRNTAVLQGPSTSKKRLNFLEDYLGKVNEDAKSKNCVSSASDAAGTTEAAEYSFKKSFRNGMKKLMHHMELENRSGPERPYDEASNLYLICILASINIAVFLFEIASPVRDSDMELFSLPLLYGAKINHLILLGEWWRLVTPMFLVQD